MNILKSFCRNKKGFFYTILVFFIISIMIVSVATFSYTKSQKEDFASVEIRGKAINTFVKDVERDMERAVYIGGYQSIFALNQYSISHGIYITEVNEKIEEILLYGNCSELNLVIDPTATLNAWKDKMNESSQKIGVNTFINITNVEITQEDSWNVKFKLNLSLKVVDSRSSITFLRSSLIESKVPINNFEDPVYMISTGGTITNLFSSGPYLENFNLTNLGKHINRDGSNITLGGSYYINSSLAPDFLHRMEGNFSASACCGIESLINRDKLWVAKPAAVRDGNSIIDYIYWQNLSYSKCNVTSLGTWAWFDENHIPTYNLSGICVI